MRDLPVSRLLGALGALLLASACSGSPEAKRAPATQAPCTDCNEPLSCAEGEREESGSCVRLGWHDCPKGFAQKEDHYGCSASVPETCKAGTMQRLGASQCERVTSARCADGFVAADDGWGCRPVVTEAHCTAATRESLGSEICAPVGDCTAAFPPANATMFVDAAGAVDATHKKTIAAAIAAATDGAVIAIAPGTYPESLVVSKSVALVGKCAAQVNVTGVGTGAIGLDVANGATVTASGMTLHGHARGVSATEAASVSLQSIVVENTASAAIHVEGAGTKLSLVDGVVRGGGTTLKTGGAIEASGGAELSLTDAAVVDSVMKAVNIRGAGTKGTLESTVIARTQQNADGAYGHALVVREGAHVDVSRSALIDATEFGVYVSEAESQVALTDVTIEGTTASSDGFGYGFEAVAGTNTLERVTIASNVDVGIALDTKAVLEAKDLVVKGTVAGADDGGYGVVAQNGATARLVRAALVENASTAAAAMNASSHLELEDSLLTGTRPDTEGERGYGLRLESGASAHVVRSAITHNRDAGVLVEDKGSTATIEDTVVAEQEPGKGSAHGRGILIELGGAATVTRSLVQGNTERGIAAINDGSSLTLSESAVIGTRPQVSDSRYGLGIEVSQGATASLTKFSLIENTMGALLVSANSKATVRDAWIFDTHSINMDGQPGRGIAVQRGATLDGTNVVVSRSRQVGVLVGDARATLTELFIEGTINDGDEVGHGLVLVLDASARVSRARVANCQGVGVLVSGSGSLVGSAVIRNNLIGMQAQDGSDIAEVTNLPEDVPAKSLLVSSDTTLVDNGTRVGNGSVPLPKLF
jgi:hypothetical protein